MKIGIIGYGKMGKLVEKAAIEKGYTIETIISDSRNPSASHQFSLADLYIDFSSPNDVLHNILQTAQKKKNLVIGTTGWDKDLKKAQILVEQHQIGCLHAPNFSLGIAIFLQIVQKAATLIDQFDDYDIAGLESHHNQKEDAPSGTANLLAQTLISNIRRKTSIAHELGNRKINPEELHFPSVRCGFHPGNHEIIFDSPGDTITLTHTARNRESFAQGAVAAAEWLAGKTGWFTFNDIFKNKGVI